MFEHQVQKYSLAQQRAVYRWFVLSGAIIGLLLICMALSIFFYRVPAAATVHEDATLKAREQKRSSLQAVKDFIDKGKASSNQQLLLLENLAACIPRDVCLTEAHLVPTQTILKGNAHTHEGVLTFCTALSNAVGHSFSICSLDTQGALIAFELRG